VVLLIVLILGGTVFANEPLISTLFFDTDIRDALNEIVLQTGINIIPDQTVSGTVTLDLVDVPLEKALNMLLIGGGFTFQKIDDFYLVGLPDSRSPAFPNLVETRTIQLNYISSGELMDLLPRFYEQYVKSSSSKNVLTISAPRAVIDRLVADIAKIDLPQRQVLIQAIVTEISSEVLREWGTNLFDYRADAGQSRKTEDWSSIFRFESGVLELWTDYYGELLAKLRILEGKNQAKIRANPRIIVTDRATANLFIGEQQLITLDPGEGATARIERIDAGVSLRVTPKIMKDQLIELMISPEISHFREGNRDDGLTVRRSELSTTVHARSGETLILAGMTLEETAGVERKVPLLGDIPLIRWFFRSTTEKEGERELLIFIIPEIVTGDGNDEI